MVSEMESRRLYIGGISDSVLENDIKAKFGEFGRIKNVEIRCKENYGNRRYFAYVDIETDSKSIDKCEFIVGKHSVIHWTINLFFLEMYENVWKVDVMMLWLINIPKWKKQQDP